MCSATNRRGAPCQGPAGPDGLCFAHRSPDRWKAAGDRGRVSRFRPPAPRPDLDAERVATASGLRDLLAECICRTRDGSLAPSVSNAIANLAGQLARGIELVDVTARLDALEARGSPAESWSR